MERAYNFNAGPAMLPTEVLEQIKQELFDWHCIGMSIMEVGHRGPDFKVVAEQSEADLRELMSIPPNYQVLFVPGGASAHFAMVPLNLFSEAKMADYVDTGIWSKKAIAEAQRYGKVNLAATTQTVNDTVIIPEQSNWALTSHADYVHYTPNETIEGIEFSWVPDTGDIPLVADMSSMILSCPIDVSRYGVIYAGAQKNLGQAGITVAIIREDLLKTPIMTTPTLYTYQIQAENLSFYNTPPTFSWYVTGLMLAWMKKKGGVAYFTELNKRKAKKLYEVIDANAGFYINRVHPSSRSRMNVSFDLPTPELIETFLEEAKKQEMLNLRGHRLAGGVRASIYNAMPEEGVDRLVEFMKGFVKKHG